MILSSNLLRLDKVNFKKKQLTSSGKLFLIKSLDNYAQQCQIIFLKLQGNSKVQISYPVAQFSHYCKIILEIISCTYEPGPCNSAG